MQAVDLLRTLVATGPYLRAAAPSCLLHVDGPDAGEFLHRLCTQDVLGMVDGEVRPAAFLDAKGKLLATCLVGRLGAAFWLETHQEQGERLSALLERYHFTERLGHRLVPGACSERIEPDAGGATGATSSVRMDGDAVVFTYVRRGLRFERRHLPGAAVPGVIDDRGECLRMLAGLVRVGVDTEPQTLALEADLDDHCSTSKGCYTGQEIVARIHTYGHVNRKLCLLHLAAGAAIAAPQPLLEPEDQLPVGRVMHAVVIPGQSARLGFGFLPKDFQAAGTRLSLADAAAVVVVGQADLPA